MLSKMEQLPPLSLIVTPSIQFNNEEAEIFGVFWYEVSFDRFPFADKAKILCAEKCFTLSDATSFHVDTC